MTPRIPSEDDIERAVKRVQDWAIPRLEHPDHVAAMHCRDVVAHAIREACGLPEQPEATFVQMVKAACFCPCHGSRGTPGDGYSHVWDDDRGIRHEDWCNCRCGCPGKSAAQRRDDFAHENAAWDKRVRSAVSDLDKVAKESRIDERQTTDDN